MTSNQTQSGASYEAILIDKITEPINDIVASLDKIEQKFRDIAKPANDVNAALGSMAKFGGRQVKAAQFTGPLNGIQEGLTKIRTGALSTGQALSQFFQSFGGSLRNFGLVLTGFAATSAFAMKKFLDEAARSEEAVNKLNVAFTKTSGSVSKWAKTLSRSIGRGNTDIVEFASTFENLFRGFGFTETETDGLSKALTELVFDLASFNNVLDEQAFQAVLSGLTGGTESMERYAVSLKEGSLNALLLSKGLKLTTKDLSEQQKVALRALQIIESTSLAQGDAARTSESWTNQTKALTAAYAEFSKELGTLLKPILLPFLQTLTTAFQQIGVAVSRLSSADIKSFVGNLIAMAGVGVSLAGVGTALTLLAGVAITVSTAISALAATASLFVFTLSAVGLAAGGLPLVLLAIGTAFTAFVGSVTGANFIYAFFSRLKDNIGKVRVAFSEFVDDLTEGTGVIREALSKEQFGTALEAAILTVKVAVLNLMVTLTPIIENALIDAVVYGLYKGFSTAAKTLAAFSGMGPLIEGIKTAMMSLEGFESASSSSVGRLALAAANAQVELGKLQEKLDQVKESAKPTAPNSIAEATDEATAPLNGAQAAQDALTAAEKQEKAAEELAKAQDEAKNYFKQFRTPIEIFRDSIIEAKKFAEILADPSLFDKAKQSLFNDFARTIDIAKQEISGPQFASIGSNAAGFASSATSFGPAFSPILKEEKKQSDLMEQQVEASKMIEKAIKEGTITFR